MWSTEAVELLAGGAALALVATAFALRPDWADLIPGRASWLAAVLGGIALATSPAAPTGWEPFDVLLRAGVGAAAVLAAARLPLAWTIWLAVIATIGLVVGDAGGWELPAAAGIGVAFALALSGLSHGVLQAASAAAIVGSLGRLDWPLVTGASSLLAAVALLPLIAAGTRRAPEAVRSAAAWAVTISLLVAVGGSVVGAASALGAATDVERAVDHAVAGLDQADADDPGPAIERLRLAATGFAQAEQDLRAWWARPALLVPGVAQHSRAVATMADAGEELATAAADSLEEVDLDRLHPVDGRIDPALLDEVEPPLDRALTSLRRADQRLADVRSPLLVGLVADRLDDLAEQVGDARRTAETASAALDVAPDLLGVDRPRRYFLVAHTPSEMRGVGGFMGSWGELVTDDGRLELTRTGQLRELTEGGPDPDARRIEGHPEFVAHWGQGPARYWGLIGFSPDFPTVASIITQLYPESGGAELDGVIAIDPAGFAALLEISGPITVEGFEGQLGPENAEQVLLHDQYLDDGDEADREAFLEAAIQALFDELTSGELPGPQSISAALAPMLDGRHLLLHAVDEAGQGFFEAIRADGSARRRHADGVGMVGQNYNGNKIDYFLRRSLTYDVVWDPATGLVEGTLEVELTNEAPTSGLPRSVIGWGGDEGFNELPVADGENLMYLSLYAALPLDDLTVDERPIELNRVVEDLGFLSYDAYLRVPSRTTSVVRATVSGQVPPGPRYGMEILRQVTPTPDQYTVRVTLPSGWQWADGSAGGSGRTAVETADASSPVTVELTAEPVDRTLLERLQGR
jgi:hypothetical protein